MSIIYKGQTIDTAGKDATINGVNNLTVEAGQGVEITQDGDVLTINSTGGGSGGGSNYSIAITFDSAFLGQPYTVTGPEEETHTGVVPDTLQETVQVYHGGSEYTVSSTDASGAEYGASVLVGSLFGSYSVELSKVGIYGVTWDGTPTTKWTRIGDSINFTDPVPYVLNATEYSSPFDNCYPWKEMVVEERTAGSMVKIPKFWYKLEQNTEGTPRSGMTIRIADGPAAGYSVSPAHMDRGDGHGERDVIYVGRYHCADDFKSKTGALPRGSMTRADFRTNIHVLGQNIWQWDFATRFTIWLLYLVEFADWNSQARIGYGCGNSSKVNTGYTDSMPFHTGTMQKSQTVYNLGTQYRNIEGLWDNVLDWCDGAYNSYPGLNIILDPNKFSDSDGGVLFGDTADGFPIEFTVNNKVGFPMFCGTSTGGDNSTYSCDYWNLTGSYPVFCVGGYHGGSFNHGLFRHYGCNVSQTQPFIGSRIMELPN